MPQKLSFFFRKHQGIDKERSWKDRFFSLFHFSRRVVLFLLFVAGGWIGMSQSRWFMPVVAAPDESPRVTTPASFSQAVDGSGYVTLNVDMSDADTVTTSLKVEYSEDGGTTWYDPIIQSISVNQGTSALDNAAAYQISAGVSTNTPSIDPILLMHMEDTGATINDTVNNYDSGTYNGALFSQTGKYGNGLGFDGTNDKITVGDVTQLNSASAFTIMGWFKQTTLDQARGMFTKEKNISNATVNGSTYTNGNLYSYIMNGSQAYGYFDYSLSVTAGQWFHYALVFDGSQSTNATREKVYINGTQKTLLFNLTIPATTANMAGYNLIIGGPHSTWGSTWYGDMDDFAIFSSALSDSQISSIYSGNELSLTTTTVTLVWDSKSASNGNGALSGETATAQVRVTPNDGTQDGATMTSANFSVDNQAPTGLGSFASSNDTTSVGLTWTAATDTNFDHYEIWYGTNQSDVQNRTGTATEWDNTDDADLATATTADTTITSLSATQYYFKIWAIDDYGNEQTVSDITGIATGNSPSASTPGSITQATDGSGYVTLNVDMSDADTVTTSLKVEYSEDGGTTWYDPIIQSISVNQGTSALDNAAAYQISAGVSTNTPSIDPILLMHMEDTGATINDTVNNYDSGTYNGALFSQTGKYGNGLGFDGTNDKITVGDVTQLNSASAFTIMGWFKQTTLDQARGMFTKEKNISNATVNGSTYTNGNLYSYIMNGSQAYGYFDYSLSVTAGQWFHYALVFDGSQSTNATREKVYINGTQKTLLFNLTIPATTANMAGYNLIIGGPHSTWGSTWYGDMDDFAIFSSALSDSQISSIYSGNELSLTTTTVTLVWDSKSASNGNGALSGEQSDIQVRVTPNDSLQDGTVATSASFTIDNVAPTGLGSFATTTAPGTSIGFSWSAVTETNFDRYDIWYSNDATTGASDAANRTGTATQWTTSSDSNLSSTGTTNTTITGLTTNSTYYFSIFAIDDYTNVATTTQLSVSIAGLLPTADPPTSFVQTADDASGYITFNTDVQDIDTQDITIKFEYSDNGGTTWYDPLLISAAGTVGTATLTDDNEYQISLDRSSLATSTLTVVWNSLSALNENGAVSGEQTDIYMRATVNDALQSGSAATSSAFTVDNAAPTGMGSFALVSTSTEGNIKVSWSIATETNFDRYDIWYGTSSSDVANRTGSATRWTTSSDSNLATIGTTSSTVTGLAGDTYYLQIWAIDEYGNEQNIGSGNQVSATITRTFTSAATGNWNIGTTWGGACSSSCTEGLDYPGSTDSVVVTSTYTVTVPSSVSSSFSNLNIGGTATFVLQGNIQTGTNITIESGGTLEQKNTTTQTITGTLTVASGGTLTHTDNTTAHSYEIDFVTVTTTVAGTIDVSGRGFNGGTTSRGNGYGTGGGNAVVGDTGYGGGAAYGGYGGAASIGGTQETTTYGSALAPTDIGSGGAAGNRADAEGGDGGGLIQISATAFTLSGSILANGDNGIGGAGDAGGGGGGSGGSVYLQISSSFNGSGGTIRTNGGNGGDANGEGGGGGGGRIAIVNYSSYTDPTTMTSDGGSGPANAKDGGVGSVFIKQTGTNGTLTYDASATSETGTAISSGASYTIAELILKSATLTLPSDASLTSSQTTFTNTGTNTFSVNGTFNPGNTSFTFSSSTTVMFGSASTLSSVTSSTISGIVTFTSGMTESITTSTIAAGATLTMDSYTTSSPWTLTDLTVNGTLTHSDNTSAQTHVVSISSTNVTIGSGGLISVSGLGYQGGQSDGASGSGTGAGTGNASNSGGGGGHGSTGGTSSSATAGGTAYGVTSTPDTIGSGGGSGGDSTADGGDGGGLMYITTTNLTHSGTITANGNAGTASGVYGGGGGAGGGIYLNISGSFTGSGSISVAGGNGGDGSSHDGGGGAGGRIAIGTLEGTLDFTGTFSRGGGLGPGTANDGGDGSLYIRPDATFSLDSSYTNLNWPGSFSGTATDHDDTISQVDISIQRSNDSKYWNGSIWTDDEQWVIGDGTDSWSYTISAANFTDATTNTIRSRATDSDGEVEATYTSNAFAYTTEVNSVPTVTVPAPYQLTTSAGIVLASTTVSDGDLHDTTTTIEYSLDNGSTWASSTLGDVTISGQDSGFTTSTGRISAIDTSAGDKLITFQWLAGIDAPDQDVAIAKFRVVADDTFDIGAYGTSSAFPLDTSDPASLANLAVAVATSHSVRLSWTAASDTNFDHYEIWYGATQSDVQNRSGGATEWDNSDDGNLATAGTTSSTITSGIAPGTYYFKIWAIDDYQNEVTVADISYVIENTLPTVAASTPGQSTNGTRLVTLTATVQDTDGVQTALIVEHSTNSTTWTSSTLSTVTPDSGDVLTSSGQISDIDTNASDDNEVTLTIVWDAATDLTNTSDDTVYIRLTPVDDLANGASATTAAFVVDTVDPTAPGNLTAGSAATTAVTMTFGAASTEDHFAEYKIFYKQAASGVATDDTAFTSSSDSNLGSSTFNGAINTTITGLLPNRVYVFNIWAYDQYGASSTATEAATYTLAAIPSSVIATENGENQIDLTWNANDNAVGTVYSIAYSNDTFIATTTDTSYSVAGLTAGMNYSFKVRAENAGAADTYSEYSSTASATTDLNAPTVASDLAFSSVTSSSLTISWADNSITEESYAVKYGTSSGAYSTTATTTSANVISTSVASLTPNTLYYFVVTATNTAGTTTSTESSTTTLAAVPTGLTATPSSQIQIDLSWNANSNPGATVYDVAFDSGTLIATTTATSYAVNDSLTANTSYSFKIRAQNSAGAYSDYSDTVSTTTIANTPTAPGAPTFSLVASSSLAVDWIDNSDGDDQEDYFEVLYGTNGVDFPFVTDPTDPDATSASMSGLSPSTTYYFRVRATNNGGTGLSEQSSTTTLKDVSSVSTDLSLTSVTSSSLSISWTDTSAGSSNAAAEYFRVKYGTDGLTFGATATTTANASITSAAVTGLSASTTYYFLVEAVNNGGVGTSASISTTTLKGVPAEATTLLFSSIASSSLSISWADASAGSSDSAASSFVVQYGTNGSTYPNTAASITNPNTTSASLSSGTLSPNTQYYFIVIAANNGGSSTSVASSTYTLAETPTLLAASTESATSISLSWNANNNPSGTVYDIALEDNTFVGTTNLTTYTVENLTPNTTYTFKVRAEHLGASGTYTDYSASASDTTVYEAPPVPSGISLTDLATSTVRINWDDTSTATNQESGFTVQYGTASNTYTTMLSLDADTTTTLVSSLSPNTTYYFVVGATNNGGTNTSAEVSTTTYRIGPIEPDSLSFTNLSSAGVTLSWNDASSGNGQEDGFVVQYSTDGTTYTTGATTEADVESADITGLSANTLYSFIVLSYHAGGISTSTVATTTTLKNAPSTPSGLVINTVTNSSIALSWTDNASGNNQEDLVALLFSTDNNTFATNTTQSADTTSATMTGLSASTTYYIKILVSNNGGSNTSDAVSTTTARNAPAMPTAVTLSDVSVSAMTVSWTDADSTDDEEDSFEVYQRTDNNSTYTLAASLGPDESSVSLGSLSPGTRYYIKVTARNSTGSATSDAVTAVMLADTPGTPVLSNPTTTTIDVTIDLAANPLDEADFAIHEIDTNKFVQGDQNNILGAGVYWQTDTQWGTTTTLTGLTPSTLYTFRVKARNADGTETGYSATTSLATLAATPGAPSISSITTTSLTVALNTNNNGSDAIYAIYSTTLGGYLTASFATTTEETWQTNVAWGSITISGLSPNVLYAFAVKARNPDSLETAFGSTGSAYTLATTPLAPALSAASVSSIMIGILEDGNDDETDYVLYNATLDAYAHANGTFDNSAIWQTALEWDTPTIGGLSVDTAYIIRLRAKNGTGTLSSFGPNNTIYTLANPAGQPISGNPSTSTIDVTIDTNGNPSNTEFALYNATEGVFIDENGIATTTAQYQTFAEWGGGAVTVRQLENNRAYQFSVIAQNGNGIAVATSSLSDTLYTLVSPAGTPMVNNPTLASLDVVIDSNGNNSSTTYALWDETRNTYIGGDGLSAASPVYQTTSTWQTITINALDANTAYQFSVIAQNGNGTNTATSSPNTGVYTLANPAGQPNVGSVTTSTIALAIDQNENSDETTYAFFNETDDVYLDAEGLASDTPAYRTVAAWGTLTATGLGVNQPYQFIVVARNGDNINAASSTMTDAVYTLADTVDAPTLTTVSVSSLEVTFDQGINPTSTEFALYESTTGRYINAAFVATTTVPQFQMITAWDPPFTLSGLSPDTAYCVGVIGKNGDDVETATSTAGCASTSALDPGGSSSDVSSGGGGSGNTSPSIQIPRVGVQYASPVSVTKRQTDGRPVAGLLNFLRSAIIKTSMRQNQAVGFYVLNDAHTLILEKVARKKGEFTLFSEPINFSLAEGNELAFDVDQDRINDIHILVSAIDAKKKKADATVTTLSELPIVLEDGFSFTNKRSVRLRLMNISGVSEIAISENPSFQTSKFRSFTTSTQVLLSPIPGKKTVYVKLKTQEGATAIISDSIIYLADYDIPGISISEKVSCPLAMDRPYKSPFSSAVYYVGRPSQKNQTICTKRAFTNPDIFFSYFSSWKDIKVVEPSVLSFIPDDVLGFMPYGPLYDPQYGALVKAIDDPKVYLLLNDERYWIASEEVFDALGYDWSWVEDIDTRLLDRYRSASEIVETDRHPNYTLIKYQDTAAVYRLEPHPTDKTKQVKRHIVNEDTFFLLHFRWDRIVTIPDYEQYEIGKPLQTPF